MQSLRYEYTFSSNSSTDVAFLTLFKVNCTGSISSHLDLIASRNSLSSCLATLNLSIICSLLDYTKAHMKYSRVRRRNNFQKTKEDVLDAQNSNEYSIKRLAKIYKHVTRFICMAALMKSLNWVFSSKCNCTSQI